MDRRLYFWCSVSKKEAHKEHMQGTAPLSFTISNSLSKLSNNSAVVLCMSRAC